MFYRNRNLISTHTLRGERDEPTPLLSKIRKISTHTLRGERDEGLTKFAKYSGKFQLTRSVGSVTDFPIFRF